MNLIDKINAFEDGTETVSSFNMIFTNCRLTNFDANAIVVIGDPVTPETTRLITINGESFRHNFKQVESDAMQQGE